MTIRKSISAVTAAIAMTFSAAIAQAETLADALTYAYEHSGLLEQNRALLRAADEDVAVAVAATLPVINWSANAQAQEPRAQGADLIQLSAQISAELVLYDGGGNKLAIEAQKETVLATRQSLRNVEQQVLLRAVQAYMNVRRDTEFVALRENNVRLITQEFRAAQDRFDVGEVTRTDVALAEARLAAARSLLAAAQGNLARSAEEFRVAVGRGPSNPTPASPAPVSRGIADAKAFAVRNHPSILESRHAVSAAELNIQRAEAAYNPRVTLNGQVGVDGDLNDGRSIGITASGPIYQGGRLSAQVRQFMARRDATRAGLHIVRHNVEQEVGNAFSFLEVARASRQASDQQTRAATVAFRGVREEATLGARTTLDVLNAEQELLDARANTIAAQADEVVASYSLLAAMGLLTAEHLRLPVQQYDPAAYYNLVKDAPVVVSEQGQALDRVLRAIGDN
ncbi:outer membrane protein [Cognatiyoonia koreensis]|uniref:Outer membrane protein n=1 Tax=Cognatiyoonia koreensis TaxID=364200 RepID=A0A1I0QGM8_9RHOB|nr:TolC family outer membrane protein [Cognatiyoonia koreensis]SEW25997.1 outer membrane protein [Cognatiyoonia koreensis]